LSIAQQQEIFQVLQGYQHLIGQIQFNGTPRR
jgi:hypothetical protein